MRLHLDGRGFSWLRKYREWGSWGDGHQEVSETLVGSATAQNGWNGGKNTYKTTWFAGFYLNVERLNPVQPSYWGVATRWNDEDDPHRVLMVEMCVEGTLGHLLVYFPKVRIAHSRIWTKTNIGYWNFWETLWQLILRAGEKNNDRPPQNFPGVVASNHSWC